jgi:hypothetical protein
LTWNKENFQPEIQEEKIMSAGKLEQTVRRALSKKERLNKLDARHVKEMVLEDGYVSRTERRVMMRAVEAGVLDDDAFAVFVDLLLSKPQFDGAVA